MRGCHADSAISVPDISTSPAGGAARCSATSSASIAPCENPPSTSWSFVDREPRLELIEQPHHVRRARPAEPSGISPRRSRGRTVAQLRLEAREIEQPPRARVAVEAAELERSLGKHEAARRASRYCASDDEVIARRAEAVQQDDRGVRVGGPDDARGQPGELETCDLHAPTFARADPQRKGPGED